jgi:hypothetical protein
MELVVHLQNTDATNSHSVSKVIVNGTEVTDRISIVSKKIAPKDTVVWTIPLEKKAVLGAAWTVLIQFTDAKSEVAVGRTLPAFFSIESWVSSAECPYPAGNRANYLEHVAARLIGDEVDNTADGELASQMQKKVKLSWEHWQAAPDVPTYLGASRNKRVGMFSGIADIQGMDLYAAACAPHITPWGRGVSLSAEFPSLRATSGHH